MYQLTSKIGNDHWYLTRNHKDGDCVFCTRKEVNDTVARVRNIYSDVIFQVHTLNKKSGLWEAYGNRS